MTTAAPERARWPRLAAAPHPLLRPLLPRGYAGFTVATTPRALALPATVSVPLVVKLADSAHRPPAFVMGPHASSWLVPGDCAPSYLEVWLDPLAACRLLGLPIGELGGQIASLADLLGAAARRLAEQLREAPDWPQRFVLMDEFLLRRMDCGPRPSPQVAWAWRRLVGTRGRVPVGQLAGEVGWSHKHLIARFSREAGLRPKTAARLIRFDRVWRHLDREAGRPDWAQLAAEAGYADQAHLIRDFRQFTGTTPGGYQARARPAGTAAGR
ncbi:MAG TPA: helix-turn-helix domain-containing protein [Streptosporangiaceae bacterium]|nr:helix-turn-helix domain-containing protein [Streptosporangiaceae bacterium]